MFPFAVSLFFRSTLVDEEEKEEEEEDEEEEDEEEIGRALERNWK
jgi:hypothetical protein